MSTDVDAVEMLRCVARSFGLTARLAACAFRRKRIARRSVSPMRMAERVRRRMAISAARYSRSPLSTATPRLVRSVEYQ
jgi:hypothetical protein